MAHLEKQVNGFVGEMGAGKLADDDVPGVDVPIRHVKEDREGVRGELPELGIHENELGAENDIAVDRGAEESSVEVAEMEDVG